MRKGRFLVLASALSLVLAGPAWAQVKQGDLDLTFHTQVEIDFEVRDNYDFNDKVKAVNSPENFFVEQETRFWMDAKAGPFESRVMIESEMLWDTDSAEGDSGTGGGARNLEARSGKQFAIEQAYGGYDFGFVKLRAGNQVFKLDPAEIIYIDDDFGVRLWQTYDWGGWNVYWVFSQEGNADAVLNPDRDRHFFMGNVDIKAAGWTVTPFVAYVSDRAEGEPPAIGGGKTNDRLDVVWIGGAATGSAGGIQVLAQFVYVTGEQDLQSNAATPTRLDLDISAWAGFLSLAYPIPGTPLTIEVAGVWMSGDDNPTDGDGEGYSGIFSDPELLNPQGIWIDDTVSVCRKVGGISASGRGCTAANTIKLTDDDHFGPRDDLEFDAEGTSSTFSSLTPASPGNYGIQYYHAGLHYKATNELTLSFLFAHIRAMEDKLLGGDPEIGNEVTFHAVWRPHKYFRVTPTLSWLIPGDAIENLTGTDDNAFNFTLETMFLF